MDATETTNMADRGVHIIRIVGKDDDGSDTDAADARITRLSALAELAFASRERAQRWLRRPQREFGGIAPLEMMETPAAARQVEIFLRQLAEARAQRPLRRH